MKKLLTIMSVFSFSIIPSLSIVSCRSNTKESSYLPLPLNTRYLKPYDENNYISGNENDFIISFGGNVDQLKHIYDDIFDTKNPKSTGDIVGDMYEYFNQSDQTMNTKVMLNKSDYLNILNQIKIKFSDLNNNHQYFMHIIKDKNNNSFKVVDTNLTDNKLNSLPIENWGDKYHFYYNSFAFKSTFGNDEYLYLNKSILLKLKGIYDSFNKKEIYGVDNWNKNEIENLLQQSKFKIIDDSNESNYQNLAICIMNLFINQNSYNEINNLLNNKDIAKIYNIIQLKFDSNNKLLHYNLYNPIYNFPNFTDDYNDSLAIQYAKDNYDDIKSNLIIKDKYKYKDSLNWLFIHYDFEYTDINNKTEYKQMTYYNWYSTFSVDTIISNYQNTINDFIRFINIRNDSTGPFFDNYNNDLKVAKFGDYWIANYKEMSGKTTTQTYLYNNIESTFNRFMKWF